MNNAVKSSGCLVIYIPRYVTRHPGQLKSPACSGMGNEYQYQSKCTVVILCGCEVKAGMAHSIVDAHVGGR